MEATMTDFQCKVLMTLVFETLDKCKTLDDFIKAKTVIAKLGVDMIPPSDKDSEKKDM